MPRKAPAGMPPHIWMCLGIEHNSKTIHVLAMQPGAAPRVKARGWEIVQEKLPLVCAVEVFDIMALPSAVRVQMINWMTSNGMSEQDAKDTISSIARQWPKTKTDSL